MSATIIWAFDPKGKVLPIDAPSTFIDMFKGAELWEKVLNQDDIPILRGMVAAMRSGDDKKALQFIIQKLYEGNIKLWAEY